MRTRLTLLMIVALALAACASVLGLRRGQPSHPFEHRAHMLKGINCVVCHSGADAAGETGPLHFPSTAVCVSCHQKPHDDRSCISCHGESYVRDAAELARAQLRFEHPMHVAASHGDCVVCHTQVADARPDTVLPKMATCFGCHKHRD